MPSFTKNTGMLLPTSCARQRVEEQASRTSQLPSSAGTVSAVGKALGHTVKLDGETARVADSVGAAARAEDRREADEERRLLADLGQDLGTGHVGERGVQLEVAVRAGAAGVDDALRDALV